METSGNGGGGDIDVKATGINLLSGVVAADGGTGEYCAPAGAVSFVAMAAASSVQNSIRAVTGGSDCEGGEIEFIGPAVTVSGDLAAHGGASASPFAIYVTATSGDLVVTSTAAMNANGQDSAITARRRRDLRESRDPLLLVPRKIEPVDVSPTRRTL